MHACMHASKHDKHKQNHNLLIETQHARAGAKASMHPGSERCHILLLRAKVGQRGLVVP